MGGNVGLTEVGEGRVVIVTGWFSDMETDLGKDGVLGALGLGEGLDVGVGAGLLACGAVRMGGRVSGQWMMMSTTGCE